MKKTVIFFSIAAALVMAGCNDVPDDVKSRTEERESIIGTAENSAHTGEIRYISLDEMKTDIDAALNDKYSNFTLRDGIQVRLPDKLTECEFIQRSNAVSDLYEKVQDGFFTQDELYGVKPYDSPCLIDKSLGEAAAVNIRGFRDDEKGLHFFVWDNGFMCMMKPAMIGQGTDGGKTVRLYRTEYDDLTDKYLLGDKEYSVKEAVDSAQKWVDEKYAPFEPDYDFRVSLAKVMQNEMMEYSMYFNIMKLYKGVKLENHYMNVRTSGDNARTKILTCHKKLVLGMRSGAEVEYLTNNDGMVKPVELKTLDKGVSLSSALEYIEKKFTDFNEPLTITDIQLKYTLAPEYDEYKLPYYFPGTTIKSRLVWEFQIAVPEDELRNVNDSYGDVCKYITVDVENGEMDYCLDTYLVLEQ